MTWTMPATYTTSTPITAGIWNEQIENDLAWLGASHDHNGHDGDGADLALIASGMIAIFKTTCPGGWTRVSAWDGKFLRGAPAYGNTGGSATHTHTTSDHIHTAPSHTHIAPSHTHTAPSHTHTTGMHAHLSTPSAHAHGGITAGTGWTAEDGTGHEFSGETGSASTGTTGSGSGTLDSGGNAMGSSGAGSTAGTATLPPYIDVVFCKKD
jgi:hypothetical protein